MKLFCVIFAGHLSFLDGVNGRHWVRSDAVQGHHRCVLSTFIH